MQVQRNEITTGLLFLITLGVVMVVALSLTVPGVFHPLKEFTVYFDSAAGMKPGATVLLAGRKVGQVSAIYSPVPERERPEKYPSYEVKVVVRMDQEAVLYADAKASMIQLGLLGEQAIDFSGGTEASGMATPATRYIGIRVPSLTDAFPKMLEMFEPVATKATATLEELQKTAGNLNDLTKDGSDLRVAVDQIKNLSNNLNQLTAESGPLYLALNNFKEITAEDGPLYLALNNFKDITDKDGSIQKTLANVEAFTGELIKNKEVPKTLEHIRQASVRLDKALTDVSRLVKELTPNLDLTLTNAAQMTDTLKRQPWRLFWPATKKYPDDMEGANPDMIIRKKRSPR